MPPDLFYAREAAWVIALVCFAASAVFIYCLTSVAKNHGFERIKVVLMTLLFSGAFLSVGLLFAYGLSINYSIVAGKPDLWTATMLSCAAGFEISTVLIGIRLGFTR